MRPRNVGGAVGLLLLFVATYSNATTGLSGGIGFARAVLLIILACFLLGGIITFTLYRMYKRKWIWVLFPVISGSFLLAVWSIQFL
jgi:hypothetical protein